VSAVLEVPDDAKVQPGQSVVNVHEDGDVVPDHAVVSIVVAPEGLLVSLDCTAGAHVADLKV